MTINARFNALITLIIVVLIGTARGIVGDK